jgi:hypothetical protein
VQFLLQFEAPTALTNLPPATPDQEPPADPDPDAPNVVSLDTFRKK